MTFKNLEDVLDIEVCITFFLSGYQCNREKEKVVAKMLCKDPLMNGCSNDCAELAIAVMKNSGLQMPLGRMEQRSYISA